MNSGNYSKGDILEATHREPTKGYHYIVYFEGNSDSDFCGCMITHSNSNNNVSMEIDHFKRNDENGNPFKVIYDETFLVRGKFLKSEDWGPYTKVGALTPKGIAFLDSVIADLNPETFADYYRKNKQSK